VYLHPNFDPRLGSLDLRYQSSYGEIRSVWSMNGGIVSWQVTIPPNTTAHLPVPSSQRDRFTLDGQSLAGSKQLHLVSDTEDSVTYEMPAGTYSFRVAME
jgi:alpha-L-rhamnosidase